APAPATARAAHGAFPRADHARGVRPGHARSLRHRPRAGGGAAPDSRPDHADGGRGPRPRPRRGRAWAGARDRPRRRGARRPAPPARFRRRARMTEEQAYRELLGDDPARGARGEAVLWEPWPPSGNAEVDRLLRDGVAAMERQDFARAEALFAHIIEIAPDFAEGWNKRATVRYLAEDFAGAIADCGETLAGQPRPFGGACGRAAAWPPPWGSRCG